MGLAVQWGRAGSVDMLGQVPLRWLDSGHLAASFGHQASVRQYTF
jgi:hypothetical protein